MKKERILKDVIRAAVLAGRKAGETANRLGGPSLEAGMNKILRAGKNIAGAAFIPVGLAYFKKFFTFPDKDISILGVGAHRNFLFHSAAPVFILSMIYRYMKAEKGRRAKIARKLLGKVAGYSAFGLGLHLLIDIFEPKAILFPFVGSLVKNTLWDDKLWLLFNAVLSFWKGAELLKDSSEESVLESIPFRGDLIDFIRRKRARMEEGVSPASAF